jgi:nucleosome binding factor SPN SPT16 subunit
LEALKDSSIPEALPVEVITFTKDEAVMKEKSEELIKTLAQPEFQPIGTFPKDKVVGGFYDMWEKIKASHSDNWKEVDATLGIAEVLCYKEDSEIKLMQSAGKTTVAMAKYMVKQVVAYADKGANISHIDLSRKIEDLLFNTNKLTKLDIQADINYDLLDWAHMPCVQSGGTFDLKYHAASNKQNLYAGVIICSLGVRYSSYCTYETRTLFINATKKQEENYKFLMDTYNHTLNSIKVGMKFSELYKIAQDYVAENRPDLAAKFNKNCGFVIGIELRENTHVISLKCDQTIEHNTCLVFNIGFTDLENPEAKDSRGKHYALSVADTIRVTHSQPSFLTIGGKKLSDICYSFEDSKPSKPGKATSENGQASKSQNSAILQTKFRSQAQEEETPEQRRRTHQQELFEKKNRDGLLRYQDDGRDGAIKDNKAVFKSFESYKRETAIPREVRSNNVIIVY